MHQEEKIFFKETKPIFYSTDQIHCPSHTHKFCASNITAAHFPITRVRRSTMQYAPIVEEHNRARFQFEPPFIVGRLNISDERLHITVECLHLGHWNGSHRSSVVRIESTSKTEREL